MHGAVGHIGRHPCPLGVSNIWGSTSPYHMQIPLEHKDAHGSIGDIWGCLNIWGHQGAYKGSGHMNVWEAYGHLLSIKHACL